MREVHPKRRKSERQPAENQFARRDLCSRFRAGINPDFLPYVFERFRQADGSTTRAHGGLGLGLAIVRHLVELHGGVASADSEAWEEEQPSRCAAIDERCRTAITQCGQSVTGAAGFMNSDQHR